MRPADRVVITGAGAVNAFGDLDATWAGVAAGRRALRLVSGDGGPEMVVGACADFDPAEHAPRRLVVKTDRFSHLALAASAMAIDDAGLDLSQTDRDRVGIWLGNTTGGWAAYRRGLDEYYGEAPAAVNSWLATAWFPTSAQGWLGIHHKLGGHSKSFACDRASGAVAMVCGVRALARGRIAAGLLGGTEAAIDPLGRTCMATTGELSKCTHPGRAYLPFSGERSGLVLGEGAAIVVAERLDHAAGRGARPLAEVLAARQGAGDPGDPGVLARVVRATLADAGLAAADLGMVVAEGGGGRRGDAVEADGLARALGGVPVPVTTTKPAYGHLYGAAFPIEVALAVRALATGTIPAVPGVRAPDTGLPVQLQTRTQSARLRTALVTACSRDGTVAAMIVARADDA